MTLRTIITYRDPRLRKKAIRVKRPDASIQSLIEDMIETMRNAHGVGLAAPQVGILLRIIVIEFTEEDEDGEEETYQTVLLNPEIVAKEGEWMAEEGCLSIPGFLGTVPRAETVKVQGQDRHGKRIRFTADGYLAHILQHEIDHLEGILYVDYLEHGFDDLRPVEPEETRKKRRAGTIAMGQDGEDEEPATETAASQANQCFDPCCAEPAAERR
jgi:peptide deformylase